MSCSVCVCVCVCVVLTYDDVMRVEQVLAALHASLHGNDQLKVNVVLVAASNRSASLCDFLVESRGRRSLQTGLGQFPLSHNPLGCDYQNVEKTY